MMPKGTFYQQHPCSLVHLNFTNKGLLITLCFTDMKTIIYMTQKKEQEEASFSMHRFYWIVFIEPHS